MVQRVKKRAASGKAAYVGVVKALQSISSVDVVAFGASVAAKKASQLLDAHGNVSRIPVEVPDAKEARRHPRRDGARLLDHHVRLPALCV